MNSTVTTVRKPTHQSHDGDKLSLVIYGYIYISHQTPFLYKQEEDKYINVVFILTKQKCN